MPRFRFAASAIALPLLALGGCQDPADVLNALTPTWSYDRTEGLAYGSDPRQVLDLYRPRGKAIAPMVIFFYGGRWEGGTRRDFRFVADAFAGRGYAVAIPDYRVYPQVTFPAFVEDGAKAVRYALDHAAEFGGDPDRLILAGHSSGAHTAAMLALDPHYLRDAGVDPARVRALVGISGPYDFLPFDPDIQLVMGPEAGWPDTQPINHVRPDAPPMLLLQGGADDVVNPRNAQSLEEKERAVGGAVTRRLYPRLDHYRTLLALAAPLRFLDPVLDDVTRWLGTLGLQGD